MNALRWQFWIIGLKARFWAAQYRLVVAARGWLDGYANWLDAASARSLHIVGSGFIPKEGAE